MAILSGFRAALREWTTQSRRTSVRPRLALVNLEGREVPAVGGGFLGGGLLGEYFDNPNLAGSPEFTRRDVRIDFDWGTAAPGGSTANAFRRVGADNFSVRWTGQLIPRFSETYLFRAGSDDGVRVWIKPADGGSWTQLIDNWDPHAYEEQAKSFAMTAGKTYDVRIDYFELGGQAAARLSWASPSTPEETIDPATNLGINAITYADRMFADTTKMGRADWGDPNDYFHGRSVGTDGDGWPTDDSGHLFWEGKDPSATAGTYRLKFRGKAEVFANFQKGRFFVGGRDFGNTLPNGVGYDPTSNTTTADVVVTGAEFFLLTFRKTQRESWSETNTGITNVQLMRPGYQPDEVFDRDTKAAFSRFTTLRFLSANFNAEQDWNDRKRPTGPKGVWTDRAAVWEYEVMLANETGKDLYITLPINASDDYVRKVAKLIRFGSDGTNPYDGQVGAPRFPGLNSNLRVYVEWGNEVWNWAFDQGKLGVEAAKQAVRNNTPDGRITNFDGQRPEGDYRRWTALRTVRASDTFRSVFGDAAMGDRVRVVLEYQYDNHQETATEALRFIDAYFNNGDGQQHVGNPKPVSYYLWGAGGASYFGASNPRGLLDDVQVPNGDFNWVGAASGKPWFRPDGAGWQFTGDAGIYRNPDWASANQTFALDWVGSVPAAASGNQAMFVSGTGSASVTIDFPKSGMYALDFQAAAESGGDMANPLDFYFDDRRVTPDGWKLDASATAWKPGGFGRDSSKFEAYGTVPVWVPSAGRHTFKIVGRGRLDQTTVIDDVRAASADAIFNSNLPGGGHAAGQVSIADYQQQLANQARYARAYGLNLVAYEGGWSLGGDFHANPLMSHAKYRDPRAGWANTAALAAFQKAGGELNVLGTYEQWRADDPASADDAPLVQGIDAALRKLPAEPTTGTTIPGTLPISIRTLDLAYGQNHSGFVRSGEWVSWDVIAPTTGDYSISANTSPGGRAMLLVDGDEIAEAGSSGRLAGTVRLTKGIHSVRVQNIAGTFYVPSITAAWVGAPGPLSAPSPTSEPTPAPRPSSSLTAGWSNEDVGSPSVRGSAKVENGRWTVTGAGENIWGSADEFQFAHISTDGDTTITARVDSLENTHAWAKAGVMIRGGTGESAGFAAVLRTPENGLVFQWRSRYRAAPEEVRIDVPDGPIWTRVVRRGNSFAGYYSTDGKRWTRIGEARTVLMPNAAEAGLAVTSHDPSRAATARFSGVSVV